MLKITMIRSPSLDKSLNAAMIGVIVASVLKNSFTQLQLALGTLVRDKQLTEHLQECGIASSYHEVRRYKLSAAVESYERGEELHLSDCYIQVVSDIFEAHFHSQNRLKEAHSFATIITQPQNKP